MFNKCTCDDTGLECLNKVYPKQFVTMTLHFLETFTKCNTVFP